MNDGTDHQIHVWDHRTADACGFRGEAARILPLLETRILPVALPGERVILSAGGKIPDELALLRRLGFGCSEEDLIFVSADFSGAPSPFNLEAVIYPFTSCSAMSQALRAGVEGCSFRGCDRDVAVHVNRKATLQSWAGDKIRVPEGRFVQTPAQIRSAIEDLLARHQRVVYKPDFSASGVGQVHFYGSSDLSDAALEDLMRPGVVQAFVHKTCDVSLQFEINVNYGAAIGNGLPVQPILRELTGQFVGEDGDYLGGFYPTHLNEQMQGAIRNMGMAVATKLMISGYRGSGSIDYMVGRSTEEIWVNDVNARVVAPWYALEMIRRRHPQHRPLPFIMRSFRIPVGMSISAFEELFRGHFFSWKSQQGFVPFAFLPEVGFCYGVVFADSLERCRDLDSVIEQTKQPLRLG